MNRKLLSSVLSISMAASVLSGFAVNANADSELNTQSSWTANTTGTPQYQDTARQMEELNRGLIATYRTVDSRSVLAGEGGVYLSWRLLGTESLANQAFDIYRASSATGTFTKIKTTGAHDATNYIDTAGTASNYYKVVKSGASTTELAAEKAVKPGTNNTAKGNEVGNGNSHKNSFTYVDIPIDRPDPVARVGDGKLSYYYSYDTKEGGANDGSIGDLDGDGDYEMVLKWDPTDSKDSAGADFTGHVYIDGYELDPNNGGRMWRIDLGQNITAGAHYTQFIVFDFDGDGKSEIAMATAPGTIDGQGNYVTMVGDSDEIRNADNTAVNVGLSGSTKGRNIGPEYYTIFEGDTGAALWTTDAIPLGTSSEWGDAKYNRASRFLAGVAYLDGVHPSYIACRGYYNKAVLRAYTWDGESMSMQWEHMGNVNDSSTMYGQGNHNLSIADIDNDGMDEIVYGSAALDQDGKKVLGNTRLGHGDAIHTSDFNNDGIQETFTVKEDSQGYKTYAADLRTPKDGKHFWESGKITTSGDNGRGVMANIDDAYASTHPNALALGWDSGHANVHDLNGDDLLTKPSSAGSGSFDNSLIYWDGDLSRELLDANIIQKYDAETGYSKRFYSTDGYTLTGGSTNNYTKRNATLTADIWGDWREEVVLPINKGDASLQAYLRVYTSTIPTDYRLTTLMHDSQYRTNVAIQNVGYNQPPHQSYYIGTASLAQDGDNQMNYLAPETLFTNVTYSLTSVPVEGITLSPASVNVEKGKTTALNSQISPADASRKAVTWTSSNPDVATVAHGIVTGEKEGTTTITATTKDGGFTATSEITVYQTHVTGISLPNNTIEVGIGYTKPLLASVTPENATDKTLIWSSSDASIATVDSSGNISGISSGQALITATTVDGNFSAYCTATILPLVTTDITGDNVFEATNVDAASSFTGTATSANLTHNDASTGAEFSKAFTPYGTDKANLSFKFVTGGQKYDGTNWNWTGHEYTLKVKFLDKDGNNILEFDQPYGNTDTGAAGKLTSKMLDKAATNIEETWTYDGLGNIQGSAKRWIVNLEFDYDNDLCTPVIIGCDSSWSETGRAECTPFALNGASFKTLKVETVKDGTGTIKANPQLSDAKYDITTLNVGATDILYQKGVSTDNAWQTSDLTDWKTTGDTTLNLDTDNDRIFYNPTKPGSSYSASKDFSIANDSTTITYNIDWYFGNATSRTSNFEYLQIGSKLRLGYTSDSNGGYYLWVSTDGGTTWNDNDNDEVPDSIFGGGNDIYTKNVKLTVDCATKKIISFSFDNNTVSAYTDYDLGEVPSAVSFGLQRGGATDSWTYPNGIDAITVSQFTEGKTPEPLETPSPKPTVDPNAPTATPSAPPTATPTATPVPTEPPVASNSFDNAAARIMYIDTAEQGANTSVSGLNLYIGTRAAGADSTTNFSYETGGVSGNALVMNSGQFSNSNRGPRFEIVTPVLEDNTEYTATIQAKSVNGSGGNAELFYGSSTSVQATAALALTADSWNTIKIVLTKQNGSVSRSIYLNDNLVKTENSSVFPVFWGTSVASTYAKVYFDNLLVTAEEKAPVPTLEPTVKPTLEPTATPSATPVPTSTPTATAQPDRIEVTINPISITDTDFEITVKNNGDSQQPVKLLVASYNADNTLAKITFSNTVTIASGETQNIASELPSQEAAMYKIMLWDGTSALNPLMTPITELPLSISSQEILDEPISDDFIPEIKDTNPDKLDLKLTEPISVEIPQNYIPIY